MFQHVNLWYFIAPIGAIVTALVGYNRSHRHGKHYLRLEHRTTKLDVIVATFFAVLLCVFIFFESHRGLIEVFVARSSDDLAWLIGWMVVLAAPIATAVVYGLGLFHLARRCACLGAKPTYYCRVTKQRAADGREKLVIKASDLAHVLAEATGATPKERRRLQYEFERHEKVIAFKQHNTVAEPEADEPASTETLDLSAYSAPSAQLVEFEFCNPDGIWHKMMVPVNRLPELQTSVYAYYQALTRALRVVNLSTQEAEEIIKKRLQLEDKKNTTSTTKRPTAQQQLQTALRDLSPEDQQLVLNAVEKRPGLFEKVDAEDARLYIKLIGEGKARRVCIGGMRYSTGS